MGDLLASRCLHALVLLAIVTSSRLATAATYSFQFTGTIDGSDVIHVSREVATWEHKFWDWPSTVVFNGQSWTPQSNPALMPSAGYFLPDDLSQYRVEVVRNSNRDVATAGIYGDELRVFLADSPNGSGAYDIEVNLLPKPLLPLSTVATLKVIGQIDGSDLLRISQTGALWQHLHWSTPTTVFLNDVSWNPAVQTSLPNSGATQFLPAGIDFRSAQLQSATGRDVANIEVFDDYIDVYFDDTPNGSGTYEVIVTFGVVPEPSTAVLALAGMACASMCAIRRRRPGRR